MKTLRRVTLVLFVLLVAVAGFGYWWWQSQPAGPMNPLDRWCATQLRRMAGDLLAPEFDFRTLKLDLPATVTLEGVSLTSNGVAIVKMSSLQLEFAETPRRGQPLVIQAATFVDPEVRLIERAEGGLQGFTGFMKSTSGKQYEDGGSSKPSDFLAMRHITIKDGLIEWTQQGHEHPMRFEKLDVDLGTSPDEKRPGWYELKAQVDRAPIIQLIWDGGISIDNGDLALDDVNLQVDLSQDDYAALNPSTQDFLRKHSIVGDLALRTTGLIPLGHAEDTDLTFDATLTNASSAIGDYQFPVDTAHMQATFRQMQFACNPLSVTAFGGQIDATGTVGFAGARAFTANVKATDVLIQNMLRPESGMQSDLAGKIVLNVDASGEYQAPDVTLNGTGHLSITEGTLIGIPAIGAMANVLHLGDPQRGRDKGEVDFTLASDRATLGKSTLASPLVAAKGRGDIHYDGRLDLVVNAGPLKKAESLLGPIGDIIGAVTDNLIPYEVSGTWTEPVVTPKPLGIGLGK